MNINNFGHANGQFVARSFSVDQEDANSDASNTNIRIMSVKMAQKKNMKFVLENHHVEDRTKFKWKRKSKFDLAALASGVSRSFTLWKNSLRVIEIKFGTNSMLYFKFIKFLLFFNVFMSSLIVSFVIAPNVIHAKTLVTKSNVTFSFELLLDLFQGTGLLENSLFFYGYYSDSIMEYINRYSLSLAYMEVLLCCLLISLFVLIKVSVSQFNENYPVHESIYSRILFGTWVFSVDKKEIVQEKHSAITREISSTFEMKVAEENRRKIIILNESKTIAKRVLINLMIALILIGSAVLVYFVFHMSSKYLDQFQSDLVVTLCFQFLPSVTITLLNKIVPAIFLLLVKFEVYSELFTLRITLFRMVFLRLFSLCIVFVSLYNDIKGTECWETKVGQQMYKMLITEFLMQIISVYVINLLVSRIIRCFKKSHVPNFDLPRNVLDLVFMQTIAWFGLFYAPILPVLLVLIYIALFHMKKFEIMNTNSSKDVLYHKSHSNSTFTGVLLLSLMFAFIPLVYCISTLKSSMCGPFRRFDLSWDVILESIECWPSFAQEALNVVQSYSFIIAMFLILCLTLYTYFALASRNELVIKEMTKQLNNLGSSKQHLRKIYHKYKAN